MPWNIDLPEAEWYTFDDPDVHELVKEIELDVPILAIDTETTGLNVVTSVPLFWSLSWGERRICMPADTIPLFEHVLKDPDKKWVLANAKYDQHILANAGSCEISGDLIDVQVMDALLYEEQPHNLKYMAKTVLGWGWSDFKDTFRFNKGGKLHEQSVVDEVRAGGAFKTVQDAIMWCYYNDLPKLIEYASNDAYGTWKNYVALKEQLERARIHSLYPDHYETLSDYFFKIEVPFTRVLWACERHGTKIDLDYLLQTEKPVKAEMDRLSRDINREAGKMLNPNSHAELSKVFFKERGYKPKKMTKGGKKSPPVPSVDADVLEALAEDGDKLANLILEHRELGKLLSTYVEGLRGHVDHNGRVHTRFNQDVARCMPAGELVLTNRGYIPVETVKKGDLVITHKGRVRPVVETSVHQAQRLYKVTTDKGHVLRTTGNHEFQTTGHVSLAGALSCWLRANQLKTGTPIIIHSARVEVWKNIPDWENYQVSSWGRVRNATTGKVLKLQKKGKWGHLKITLRKATSRTRRCDFGVHQLVLRTFVHGTSINSNQEVRHLNGIAWDNTLENLTYGTSQENSQDAIRDIWAGRKWSQERREPTATFGTATVAHIEREEMVTTYGLTVEEDHSHVTGGIVTHNTGRLSSAGPNLQNIPNPERDKFQVRKAFIPEDGMTMIVADYDTLEMRLLAAASEEPKMVKMILEGKDLHMGNATLVFGNLDSFDYDEIAEAKATDKRYKNGLLDASSVTDRMHFLLNRRRQVKTIGFGLNYGMKEKKLAHDLGITVEEAVELMEAYMNTYPAVRGFFAEAVAETKATGYSFTVLGRRRFLPDIISGDNMSRWRAERQACNTPIQGSAADVVKMAMIRCYYDGDLERQFGCRMLLQVHDELMFETPPETVEEVKPIIRELMEHSLPTDLAVPLTVSMGVGNSWAETH